LQYSALYGIQIMLCTHHPHQTFPIKNYALQLMKELKLSEI